ncbi:hypothetical protein MP228_006636 [Amoeboaphelidium protococcarum]|nr:hypothetical protein MP228_006636 [Amoeboaphelidium protococcarum]
MFSSIKRVLNEDEVDKVDDHMPTVIHDTMCMQCGSGHGKTQLLLTSIPHFKEVIISAFECPDCGWTNNGVESASQIQDHGVKYVLSASNSGSSSRDLNRRVIKGEYGCVVIREAINGGGSGAQQNGNNNSEALLEIPAGTQKGSLNTVEGFIVQAIDDIRSSQGERLRVSQEKMQSADYNIKQEGEYMYALYQQLDAVVDKLQQLVDGKMNFQFSVDDPSGNSYIESLDGDTAQVLSKTFYQRTSEQIQQIGLNPDAEKQLTQQQQENKMQVEEAVKIMQQQLVERDLKRRKVDTSPQEGTQQLKEQNTSQEIDSEEVLQFPSSCPNCYSPTVCRMKLLSIPYFKEVLIMATACDADGCGYKSNEVKASGAVSEKGKRIQLLVTSKDDLDRDILKSESCGIAVPELELTLDAYTLGGKFTTIEGLLTQVKDELYSRMPFLSGDSDVQNHAAPEDVQRSERLRAFLQKLQKCIDFDVSDLPNQNFHFIMDDPLGNCYMQNPYAPDADPNMKIELYERSDDQNEMLGLNDMDVTTGVTYD